MSPVYISSPDAQLKWRMKGVRGTMMGQVAIQGVESVLRIVHEYCIPPRMLLVYRGHLTQLTGKVEQYQKDGD